MWTFDATHVCVQSHVCSCAALKGWPAATPAINHYIEPCSRKKLCTRCRPRAADIQLVVVGSAGNHLALYKLGQVLLSFSWLNPVGGKLFTNELEATVRP